MLGYIRPFRDELLVKEDIFYKGVYCGLCHILGKKICRESRLLLSYDVVFLAFCRYMLEEKTPSFVKKRCPVPPFRKKLTAEKDEILEYCASVCSLLAWYKLDDDVRDSRGFRKLFFRILRFFGRRMKRKAGLDDLSSIIRDCLSEMSELEKKESVSADELAETSGRMTAAVFAYGYEGERKRIAEQIGFHIGKWVYFADAADDLKNDIEKNYFNPFSDGFSIESCRAAMHIELQGADLALELISGPVTEITRICSNVIKLGLPAKTEEILNRGS
ncbi:MAG: hypothetical protein J5563_06625 [Clostridia bacterium]|nr:hypothetical protein [Clostridia bacterium]